MSTFNPGDILTISTASYKRRRFTVLESNGHRTVLRGSKGAHRVLVAHNRHRTEYGADLPPTTYSIHEDDGEKNRGRLCTVDQVERAESSAHFGGESDARTSPAEPFKIGQSLTEMITAPPEVERLLARNRRTTGDTPTRETIDRPVESRSVARARMLDTEWGIVSANNRMAAGESLAEAMTKLLEGDLSGARASAESAARKLTTAKVFEYVAMGECRKARE